MWLIVAQDSDGDADWLAAELRGLGLVPLEVVRAAELVHGATWEHRVGPRRIHTVLRLADGRVIDSADVDGVLNRLLWVGATGFRGASEQDREYAGIELFALTQSWLEGFGARAINRPAASGLSGAWRAIDHWRWLARAVGLEMGRYRSAVDPCWQQPDDGAGHRWLVLLDGAPMPGTGAPEEVVRGCIRLADAARLDLVGMRFGPEAWQFEDATACPILAPGEPTAARVAQALRGRAQAA